MSLFELLADKPLLAGTSGDEKSSPKEEERTTSKDDLILVGEGLPPISSKIVQSIERGDFIDLAQLLPKTPNWDDEVYTEVADQVILISKVKPTKQKSIQDLPTWVEAFCTFAAVKGKKFPKLIPELMAYAATIAKAARDYGGKNWLTYDYRFRQLAATRKTETGWGQKDLSLWNETFIKPKYQGSQGAEDTESPSARLGYHSAPKKRSGDGSYSLPSSKKPPSAASKKSTEKGWRSHICYAFSYSGKCPKERCEYLHLCYECGESHSQVVCSKKKEH